MSAPGTYIVAEMACSHDGDPALARATIAGAGEAGASAVQFQIWAARDIIAPQHPDFALVCGLELSRDEWRGLVGYARAAYPAMDIIACVYEPASVDFAETLGVDAYKLHNADLTNPELVRHVARTGRRIDLSVGASTIGEIAAALEWIDGASTAEVWLMYGYQAFPTALEDVHLRYLLKLGALFERRVGYQDHTDAEDPAAFWIPAAAVGMGIDVVEKHITHDRFRKGADHQAALNPDEFGRFVRMVRSIETARGSGRPRAFSPAEERYRRYARKSVVAARDLAAGHVVQRHDVVFLRTGEVGIPPADASLVIGRTLRCPITRYHPLSADDVS